MSADTREAGLRQAARIVRELGGTYGPISVADAILASIPAPAPPQATVLSDDESLTIIARSIGRTMRVDNFHQRAQDVVNSLRQANYSVPQPSKISAPAPPQSGEVTDGRRSGHSKLVYDKATRSIVTVRTPQSEREVEAVALARASLVEMMEEGPNLRVKGNRHDRARAAIAALDALRARAGEA